MCKLLEQSQPSLSNLIAILPDAEKFKALPDDMIWDGELSGITEAMVSVLPLLREQAGNCPTCILAALRQAKIPVPAVSGFDYGTESKSVRAEFYENLNADKYDYV
jgi:hypothetical protein